MRTIFKLVLFLSVVFPFGLSARERAWSWCEEGNQVITVLGYQSSTATPVQRSYPSCTITVYLTGSGGQLATLYSDNNGTPLANPFTAQTNGYWFFYADNGRYDVSMSGAGFPGMGVTLGDILLNDPSMGNGNTYMWAHFKDDNQTTLFFSVSSDMLNWRDIAKQGSFSVNAPDSLRDPSYLFDTVNNTFYFVASPSSVAGASIHFWSSKTLLPGSFSAITLLNVTSFAPGATAVFAPELWHDPNTGNDYLWMPISTATNPNALNAPFTMYLGQIDLPSATFVGTPQPVTINGTTQSRIFDPFPYLNGGTHTLFYVDQQPTGDGFTDQVSQPIAFATSGSLFGPYTQQTTPGTDYFGWGDFQTEASTLMALPNGCVRITVDHWMLPPIGPGSGGRRYFPEYKDSCPNLGALFSQASLTPSQSSPPLTPVISNSEQGTIRAFAPSSPAVATIMNALNYSASDSNNNSRFGVNTTNPFYTISAKTADAQPGQLQFNEPPSIGLDTGDGTYAEMSACGLNSGGCALQFPGLNIWTISSISNSPYGLMQFSNANTDTQGAGVMFADGINQFGSQPTSASSAGQKAVWVVDENSRLWSPPNGHYFGIRNAGIGTNNMVTAQTLGASTNATGGCYGMQITTGSNVVNVVGLGRWVQAGNIGNHQLVVENSSGTIVAQYYLDVSTEYGVVGHYTYTPIIPSYALAAGTTYYIMSSENPGSDRWYDGTTSITPAAGIATVGQPAYQTSCGTGAPTLSGSAGHGFGPLDVQYSTNADGSVGGFLLSLNPNTGEVHMPLSLTFGSGLGTMYNHVNYGNVDSIGSLGSTNRVNIGNGTPGDSSATVVTGAVDVSNYLASRGGTNTDLAGTLTLDAGGHASYVFAHAQAATSICTTSENTIAGTGQLDGPYLPLDVAQQLDPRALQTFALKGVSVAAGATQVLAQVTASPGALTRIQYACGIGSRTDQNGCGSDGTITIIADGVTVLSATNGIFYGTYGYDSTANQGALTPYERLFYRTDHFGIDNYYTNNAYGAERNIYVPFSNSLTVQITNNSTLSQTIFTGVDWRPGPTPNGLYNPRFSQFHSLYTPLTTSVSGTIGTTFYPLPTQSPGVKGVLDSIFVFIDGTQTVPVWLEGHPKVIVDGVLGPTQNGTEDFFCSHYYFIQPTHSNECGALFIGPDTVSGTLYFTGMYRFFRQMPVPFNTSIAFSMENGHVGEGPGGNVPINYASLVTWYTAGTNDADNYLPIQNFITTGPATLQIYGTPNRAVSYHCIAHEF